MELTPPYAYIYQISLYCPHCMHTYLTMWDEQFTVNKDFGEDQPHLYVDPEVAVRFYSIEYKDFLSQTLQLAKVGCLSIESVTADSLLIVLHDEEELTYIFEESEDGNAGQDII